jgi:DNA-binding FadR family transcriptional regulator
MRHAHARIAEAVIAGDAEHARRRMRRHLQAESDFLRGNQSIRQQLPDQVVAAGELGNGKRAEVVARHITQAIVGARMRSGEFVGAERDLIEQQHVSRAVLREAVRLLEHHQIARMRRGPGGGLFVFEPSASAVTEIVAIYLARRGMRPRDLAELRTPVETTLAVMAARRIEAGDVQRMTDALASEQASSGAERFEVAGDLHTAVAGGAHNRVLELVALVLIRLSRLHQIERLAPKARDQVAAEVLRAHEGIAAAVESGDHELAGQRMRRHLDALAAVMR